MTGCLLSLLANAKYFLKEEILAGRKFRGFAVFPLEPRN